MNYNCEYQIPIERISREEIVYKCATEQEYIDWRDNYQNGINSFDAPSKAILLLIIIAIAWMYIKIKNTY